MRFRDSGGERTISIGGWRISGYGEMRGENQSRPNLKTCGAYSSPSKGYFKSDRSAVEEQGRQVVYLEK